VAALAALVGRPVTVRGRRLPPVALVVLAAIGAVLLAVIATAEWVHFNDEHAYWLGAERLWSGQPLYDATAAPNTPFAYWYPPPLAQVLAPFTGLVSADAFSLAWTVLLLACLWWLGGRDVLVALALIAFLPVAVELRVRNVHLVLAVLIVLALRRGWAFWIPAAALKITPVLGGLYLAAAGRWRAAVMLGIAGVAVLGVSVAVSPAAWQEFISVVGARAGTDGGALIAIPFPVRFVAAAILTIVAGRMAAIDSRDGRSRFPAEALLVVALTIGNPTLWATAFSMLIAIVPLWRSRRVPGTAGAPAPPVAPEVSAA
jgi:hypothetical protein